MGEQRLKKEFGHAPSSGIEAEAVALHSIIVVRLLVKVKKKKKKKKKKKGGGDHSEGIGVRQIASPQIMHRIEPNTPVLCSAQRSLTRPTTFYAASPS